MQQLNPSEISEIIKQRIDDLDVSAQAKNEGTIVSVMDGIIRIHGLADVMYGEMIEFEGGIYGMALNLERDSVGAIVLGDYLDLREGQTCRCTKRILEVPVGPELEGRVVDALARGQPTVMIVAAWAVLGLFAIVASVVVAVAADRLAHRQRLAAMSNAFEHAITLPISYHAERGTGTVVRTVLAGAVSLFGTWLTVLREQIAAIVSVALLAPVAFWMEWRLASLLALLAVLYGCLNVFVIRRTSAYFTLKV